MQNIKRIIAGIIYITLFLAKAAAQNDSVANNIDSTVTYKDSMHNQRYCEIVLVKVSIPNVTISVYNTIGINACPEEQWKNINTDKLKKDFSVHTVVANGPRYYLMDKIGMYNTGDTTITSFDSLQAKLWVKIRMGMGMALKMQKTEVYKERPFKMVTAKYFNKGSTVFELLSPEHTYIMESYSAEVDSTLKEADLPMLAQRLQFPTGWQYKVITLDSNLQLLTTPSKESFGIEDELGNRYQRID